MLAEIINLSSDDSEIDPPVLTRYAYKSVVRKTPPKTTVFLKSKSTSVYAKRSVINLLDIKPNHMLILFYFIFRENYILLGSFKGDCICTNRRKGIEDGVQLEIEYQQNIKKKQLNKKTSNNSNDENIDLNGKNKNKECSSKLNNLILSANDCGGFRLFLGECEIGKLSQSYSNCLAPLFVLDMIKLTVFCRETIYDIIEHGTSIEMSISVYLNRKVFKYDLNKTIPESQGIIRDAWTKLFSEILKLEPSIKSTFYDKQSKNITKARTSNELFENEDITENGNFTINLPNMKCQLLPHQYAALNWMLYRESGDYINSESEISPLWEEYILNNEKIYMNKTSGQFQLNFPILGSECRGGILADEMGLGKTIEALALTSLNLNEGGPTLVVVPLSVLHQWVQEINLHTVNIKFNEYYSQSKEQNLSIYHIVLTTYGTVRAQYAKIKKQKKQLPLFATKWKRIILDEAHIIKSRTAQSSMACYLLNTTRRWCLTGTPIQNSVHDLFSLLHFLKVEPWGIYSCWKKLFNDENEALISVKKICQTVLIRRTKNTINKLTNEPIINLPPRHMITIYLEMFDKERKLYDAIFERAVTQFDKMLNSGKSIVNYTHVFVLILRLRQVCCHPLLIYTKSSNSLVQELTSVSDLLHMFSEYNEAYVTETLKNLKSGEVPECPICLDSCENPVLVKCGHAFCRDCIIKPLEELPASTSCPICREIFNITDLKTFKTNKNNKEVIKECLARLKYDVVCSVKLFALRKLLMLDIALGVRIVIFTQWTAFFDYIELILDELCVPFRILDGSCTSQQRKDIVNWFSDDNNTPSNLDNTYITECLQLKQVKVELSSIEYTATLKPIADNISVHKNTRILLASLKAGGVGLNLCSASRVYMLDVWWNPSIEEQATQRVHRIGQNKTVYIFKFVIKNTIEERILKIHEWKSEQARAALTNDEVKKTDILNEYKLLFFK